VLTRGAAESERERGELGARAGAGLAAGPSRPTRETREREELERRGEGKEGRAERSFGLPFPFSFLHSNYSNNSI
jgi:hypothetical protein